ncbi:MAG: hypothetical protein KC418_03410 [Anaerolineales bacterium]|nr:hypothetical protein [Anaerolineales bacterium]MCB8951205.1 hypothetical protein [Ardenticatenales bacterium]
MPASFHSRLWPRLGKAVLFCGSLFLFILAITLMKEGARSLAPLLRQSAFMESVPRSLGVGWLATYILMSGSPVAAASLTFFDAGVTSPLGTFAMITGSRLGASFMVIFLGFIYVLRGRDRATSLSMGLLSWLVTGSTYLVSFVLGAALLRAGIFNDIHPRSTVLLNAITDRLFDPVVGVFMGILPRWALFLVGTGIILISFNLFDRCLPGVSLKESQIGRVSLFVYRPWVMFLLGAGITLISMSVSVSLSILVPLSSRGFVRRENVIPYIMGANVTTFIDTLFASLLLENPQAFTIVLAQMVSVTCVSLLVLLLMYQVYAEKMINLVVATTNSNRHLALFMGIIFALPLLFLLV